MKNLFVVLKKTVAENGSAELYQGLFSSIKKSEEIAIPKDHRKYRGIYISDEALKMRKNDKPYTYYLIKESKIDQHIT